MPGMTVEIIVGLRILNQASMRPRLNAGDDASPLTTATRASTLQ